jgi:hypothetical protein
MVSQSTGCDRMRGSQLNIKKNTKFLRIIENMVESIHSFGKSGSE